MTIQEFYAAAGGNCDEVLLRLGNETRVKKVLGMLTRDKSMAELDRALECGDYASAFRAAHTLKGIALNLELGNLSRAVMELTETLRPMQPDPAIQAQYARTAQCHKEATDAIAALLAPSGEEGGRVGAAQ